ncbi:E3 ubiquitin-protein ligase sh3rf1 [Plakobranchus ocellatus]|uniref:E3 ubiquitin-protein ligase sh3rf1 n=1 Tax=Plakobranchus ocellatus TaxID=259542 RepID=A0AAV4AP23_9GAST|nr:E3 ubiquitin-protein ligase sh3rf1 [Plakobranchus ocellatus]
MDEKQINELLECSVCLDRMDHTCKVLPCQHTFCRRCLDEILLRKNELRCPECRSLVTMRVADLPTNILVVRILEGLKTNGIKLLSHSGNGAERPSAPKRGFASSSFRRESPSSHFARQGNLPCAKALYDYESDVAEDLTFKKGDIINLKRQIDDNWFQGELSGAVGHFPSNFVQVLVPLLQLPQCKALFDFELTDEGEKDCLSFKKDEMLTVIRRVDENWLEGRKGDKIGIFPLVFVELNDAAKVLISKKSSRSILQQSKPLSTPSSTSVTPVTSSTARTTATVSATETTSTPSIPQRSLSAPTGEILFPSSSSVPGLVVVPHIVGYVSESSTIPVSQANGRHESTAAVDSSPATSLTSSDSAALTPASSPSETQSGAGVSTEEQAAAPAVSEALTSALVSTTSDSSPVEYLVRPLGSTDTPASENKRHSYTLLSTSTPAPVSSPLPSSSNVVQLNRRSTESLLPPGFSSGQSGVTSVSTTLMSASMSEAVRSNAAETHVKAACVPSPKHKASSSPISALSSDSSVDSASVLTAPVYTAIYSYLPQKDDELELTKGEQYTVAEKCQDGWFKGACLRTGQAGVFPGNYVHLNRHTSAFKPVHANILNIRAKGPHAALSSYAAHESSTAPVTMGGGDSSQAPPPLLPRVAKLGSQGQRSRSPNAPSPLRSLSHPATSSRFDYPAPFLSVSPASHLAGISVSSKPAIPVPPSTSQSHHSQLWSSQPMPSLATISAQPMPSLSSIAAMCASSSITPPNVVVAAPSHHSASPHPEKEKGTDGNMVIKLPAKRKCHEQTFEVKRDILLSKN